MRDQKNGIIYEFAIFCFRCAMKLMRQKPHLLGAENLKDVPTPVIFTVTHDSYFEVPSLSRVYYSLKPRPRFLIMAKDEFLSNRYLSTNFQSVNPLLKKFFTLLDKTGLPAALFRKMRLVTIHRPFVEQYRQRKEIISREIGEQMHQIRDNVGQGLSSLIFPEGTTWGYGGLKKIRSGIYQLVSNTWELYRKKVYILPINVKVDRCIKGVKDVFISIGEPQFMLSQREEFIRKVDNTLRSLHTVTFSQLASYYLKIMAENPGIKEHISKTEFYHTMAGITNRCFHSEFRQHLPRIDEKLSSRRYMLKKVRGFIRFCIGKGFLIEGKDQSGKTILRINRELLLDTCTPKTYRKQNPVGYSANELISLGEEQLDQIFSMFTPSEKPVAILT